MSYCTETDLLIGDLPTSAALSPAKYVSDAADEIDSKIGFVYTTPIIVDPNDPNVVSRPVRLLLKRINAHLASGRMILAATIPAEDERLNAYGATLVAESELAIAQIADGTIPLEGVPTEPTTAPKKTTSPLLANVDAESNVEAFYDRIGNPNYSFGYAPGSSGFVR